jgi:hypothetical protein
MTPAPAQCQVVPVLALIPRGKLFEETPKNPCDLQALLIEGIPKAARPEERTCPTDRNPHIGMNKTTDRAYFLLMQGSIHNIRQAQSL